MASKSSSVIRPLRAHRQSLMDSIASVHGDIQHIRAALERIAGTSRAAEPSPSQPKVGRPPSLRTLEAELKTLQHESAWLHSRLIELRGEPLFAHGAERLVALGIAAPPSEPTKRSRGRPANSIIAEALVFWVAAIRADYQARYGEVMKIKDALAIAQPIIRARYKKTFIARPSDCNRELRRQRKLIAARIPLDSLAASNN